MRSFLKIILCIVFLSGCTAHINAPQNRDDFVKMVGPNGGLFRTAEHVTINRPYQAVVADVTAYGNKCLNVRVSRAGSYQYKEVGGTTTFHPKMKANKKGVMGLSVQEEYGNKRANSGAPPGGVYVLVAEIHPAGNKTRLDIYHLSKDNISDVLKEWANGDKHQCPSLP